MLARDIHAAVVRHGLHPGFGVLHGVEDGADALVYDLMEEFRAPIVEACTLALFGRRALRREMFTQHADASWSIERSGWTALIRGYESWVARDVAHAARGVTTTWRGVFEWQALAYAAHCEDEAPYTPYRMDY